MKDEDKRYTLEERLVMIAASKASSPKSAAAKVKKIAKMPLQGVFSYRDLDVFADLDKEIWDSLTDEVISGYSDFCGYYFTELGRKWKMRSGKSERFGYSVPICNALVALALMLIDRSKKEMNRSARAEIADYLRLTGEDYADALVDLSFRQDGTPDTERMRKMKETRERVLSGRDGTKPFWYLLADIVTDYMEAWQEFDHIDHIIINIRLLSQLRRRNEREEIRLSIRLSDPEGYVSVERFEDSDELPDLYDKELPLESVREQIFLSNTNYSIPKLRSIAENTSSRELRERLEAYATPERLDPAADKIRKAVGDLYLLLVEPYLDMQQYHYERPLD